MSNQFLTILLIEDYREEAELIEEKLAEVEDIQCEVTCVQRLCDGLESSRLHSFDVILLDLSLPDSDGLNTLLEVKTQVPHLPIIVLTAITDRSLAIEAVRQGAEDFLIKGQQLTGDSLVRAINYAIERHRIKAELEKQKAGLQRQIERERLMGRMTERIRQSLELDEILKTTVEEVRYFLHTDRVLLYCCQEDGKGEIVAGSRKPEGENVNKAELDTALEVIRALSLNPNTSPSQDMPSADEIDALIASSVNALLTVPIWQSIPPNETYLWGQLIAYDYSGSRQWLEWEVEFLTNLGNQVAIAIKQSGLYEEVARQATLDGLTGIANRRQFDYILAKEWQRLAREKKPLSLIMCDVDFFTLYNNTYGHLVGDDCLKAVAQILAQASQRSSDLAARYGGEEFAVILPDTEAEGALTVAQNIQNKLCERGIRHERSTVSDYVTISIGIATCIPHREESWDLRFNNVPIKFWVMLLQRNCLVGILFLHKSPTAFIINAADQLLLQAKARGRNQIVQ